MTYVVYVVLKGYLYDPGIGESIQKGQFFSIILVLVGDQAR